LFDIFVLIINMLNGEAIGGPGAECAIFCAVGCKLRAREDKSDAGAVNQRERISPIGFPAESQPGRGRKSGQMIPKAAARLNPG